MKILSFRCSPRPNLTATSRQLSTKGFDIVVAHHNEDLTWLQPLASNATIYSKGDMPTPSQAFRQTIKLDNIGRESHTYLYHVVSRYESLAEVTLFVQGSPSSVSSPRCHTNLIIAQLGSKAMELKTGEMMTFGPRGKFKQFDSWNGIDWYDDVSHAHWLRHQKGTHLWADCTPAQFFADAFGREHPASIDYVEGAFFAVRAEIIPSGPRTVYEHLLDKFTDLNHINPKIGHFMERFWGELFVGGMALSGSQNNAPRKL
ncbi:hypothetical protein EV356DRAFT_531265 [Viridothelium virens]|uniref:Uncharacterized protein n=1 Tax=Viridothelium virens TaxID=1048519 RepID=A0A6A6HD46_VIRVR|nr:hypothetical protein EV356DRAFT_531265 [Viridothelium virens]